MDERQFFSGCNSPGRSSRSSSIGTDHANKLNEAVTRAVKVLKKGNKADKDFAITLAQRAHKINTDSKRYAAAMVLAFVEATANASTKKHARELFEKMVGKCEETSRLVSMWHEVYSIGVEYPKSHDCHHVTFGSQVYIRI